MCVRLGLYFVWQAGVSVDLGGGGGVYVDGAFLVRLLSESMGSGDCSQTQPEDMAGKSM